MGTLLLVTVPAVVAAVGSIVTAYVAAKVRTIASQTNGRMAYLEAELRLVRRLLDESEAAAGVGTDAPASSGSLSGVDERGRSR